MHSRWKFPFVFFACLTVASPLPANGTTAPSPTSPLPAAKAQDNLAFAASGPPAITQIVAFSPSVISPAAGGITFVNTEGGGVFTDHSILQASTTYVLESDAATTSTASVAHPIMATFGPNLSASIVAPSSQVMTTSFVQSTDSGPATTQVESVQGISSILASVPTPSSTISLSSLAQSPSTAVLPSSQVAPTSQLFSASLSSGIRAPSGVASPSSTLQTLPTGSFSTLQSALTFLPRPTSPLAPSSLGSIAVPPSSPLQSSHVASSVLASAPFQAVASSLATVPTSLALPSSHAAPLSPKSVTLGSSTNTPTAIATPTKIRPTSVLANPSPPVRTLLVPTMAKPRSTSSLLSTSSEQAEPSSTLEQSTPVQPETSSVVGTIPLASSFIHAATTTSTFASSHSAHSSSSTSADFSWVFPTTVMTLVGHSGPQTSQPIASEAPIPSSILAPAPSSSTSSSTSSSSAAESSTTAYTPRFRLALTSSTPVPTPEAASTSSEWTSTLTQEVHRTLTLTRTVHRSSSSSTLLPSPEALPSEISERPTLLQTPLQLVSETPLPHSADETVAAALPVVTPSPALTAASAGPGLLQLVPVNLSGVSYIFVTVTVARTTLTMTVTQTVSA